MLRFSLYDLLLAVFGAAVVLIWSRTPWPKQPEFNNWVLFYHQPEVPDKYLRGARLLPQFYDGIFLRNDYRSGWDLFLSNHRNEWERVAILFVKEREFWNEDFLRRPNLDELPDDSWTTGHELYARCLGRDDAVNKIDSLMNQYGKTEFLQMLKDTPWYIRFLDIRWPIFWVLAFAACVVFRLRKLPKLLNGSNTASGHQIDARES